MAVRESLLYEGSLWQCLLYEGGLWHLGRVYCMRGVCGSYGEFTV